MIYNLGPKAVRVYKVLRGQILDGHMPDGAQLPSHIKLATEFGVAPLTIRQVLSLLEEEHLVLRKQGRGTFVLRREAPAVLVATMSSQEVQNGLCTLISNAGYRAIPSSEPAQALAMLAESDSSIPLIFSELSAPSKADSLDFIRTVRRRWPEVNIAVVVSDPGDLFDLYSTPDCPVLVLSKAFSSQQIERILSLVLSDYAKSPQITLEPLRR